VTPRPGQPPASAHLCGLHNGAHLYLGRSFLSQKRPFAGRGRPSIQRARLPVLDDFYVPNAQIFWNGTEEPRS
jgi:hypothetical protein